MNNKAITIIHILSYVSAFFSVAFLGLTILVIITPSTFNGADKIVEAIFLVLLIIFVITFVLTSKIYRDHKRLYEQLCIENTYTLGVSTGFYNLDSFKRKVQRISKRKYLRNKKQYVLVFSPTSTNVVGGSNRSSILRSLNSQLATYITQLFATKGNDFSNRNYVYAFDRNTFLFYCFIDDEKEMHSLITLLSNECFKLVNEGQIKIWVQPFFGICKADEESSLTALIENAIIAKSQSEKNIESFSYFKPSFLTNDSSAAEDMLKSINNGEFIPYYQAKFSLKSHEFVSSEVLARWKTPNGIVGPSKFIEKAERAGLLNAIDMAIFEQAMKDLGDSIKRGRRTLPVSVNFSLYEFFSRNFLNHIVEVLQKNQVPPTLLEIEITETTSQVNKFLSLSVIKKLKDIGVRVLMDDFGIGFSQIENLRQIPFDAVKIDKSFTDKILTDEKTRSIVKFLIELIHANDMEAIIEGAETKEQVDLLRKLKADTIQGFYYSRPLSLEKYHELLKSNEFEKEAKKWLLS